MKSLIFKVNEERKLLSVSDEFYDEMLKWCKRKNFKHVVRD